MAQRPLFNTALESSAQEDGYEDLEEMFTEGQFNSSAAESVEYNEQIGGNDATMSIQITELNVSQSDSISIEEEDGQLIYRDETFRDEEVDSSDTQTSEALVLEYELEMPSEITETNADEVDGNIASWRRTGEDAYRGFTVEAESATPSSNPVPGFGVAATTVALMIAVLVGARRKI